MIPPCFKTCPYCDNSQQRLFLRLVRGGVCDFIIETMIINNKSVGISELGSLLYQLSNVGAQVYVLKQLNLERRRLFVTIPFNRY